jgi:YfiH family protein
MNCRPLFVGKNTIGDRFDDGKIFVFFGNKTYTSKEAQRLTPERTLKFLKQVHGNVVVQIATDSSTEELQADGFITNAIDTSLGIYTADCIPALFHDPVAHYIGAAHAGWRGVATHVIPKTLLQLKAREPDKVRVWLGPHIKRSSFEVHNDVAEQLAQSYPGKENVIFDHPNDASKKQVDLTAIAIAQMVSQGIRKENIWVSPIDTFASQNYFSYRRDGPTGRLISSITLLE